MSARGRPWRGELGVYYSTVAAYFFAFGLQFVLFPSLVAFLLGGSGSHVGAAQMALSAPMFALLLFTGAFAERRQAGPTIALLMVALALPPLGLAAVLAADALSYRVVIVYALAMGTLAAFLLPVRDAALNGVVAREAAAGRTVAVGHAAAVVTAVQIAAQIAGILAGQWINSVGMTPILIGQALVLVAGAGLALRLRAPKPEPARVSVRAALRTIADGLAYAFGDKVMAAMLISSAYVGVFIVGAFQVLFPMMIREVYGGGPRELAQVYACFWAASFVSAATLSVVGSLSRPGLALLCAHALSAVAMLLFATPLPLWAFFLVATLWGLASGLGMSLSRSITQAAADPAYLGRVLAAYAMGFMGGAPLGALATGMATDALGPQRAALIPGGGLVIAAILLAVFSPLWSLRRPDPV